MDQRQQLLLQFRKNLFSLEIILYTLRTMPTIKTRFSGYYHALRNIYNPLHITTSPDLQIYFQQFDNLISGLNKITSKNDDISHSHINDHINHLSCLNQLEDNNNLTIVNKFYDDLLEIGKSFWH